MPLRSAAVFPMLVTSRSVLSSSVLDYYYGSEGKVVSIVDYVLISSFLESIKMNIFQTNYFERITN